MYWHWNRIPELADLPPEERKRLWGEAQRDPFRLTDFLWLALILGVAVGAGIGLIYVPTNLSIWIVLPIFLVAVFGFGALSDALLILRYRPIVRRLRGGASMVKPHQDTPIFGFADVVIYVVVLPLMAWSVISGVHRSWQQGTSVPTQWLCACLLLLLVLSMYVMLLVRFLRRRRSGEAE